MPPAFAPASEKARCRFEVLSTLPSPSWSDSKRARFDGTALGVEEQDSNTRNSEPPVRPEHVGWGDVRDLLRPVRLSNNETDKIVWEKLDNVTISDNSEIHDHDHSSSAPGSAERVLSCEITRASEGGTFVHSPCVFRFMRFELLAQFLLLITNHHAAAAFPMTAGMP